MNYFLSTSRWLLLGCLVYSPWAYGSTRHWTIEILDNALILCLILHIPGLFCKRTNTSYPRIPLFYISLLLLLSACMYLNAHSYFDDSFEEFVVCSSPFPGLPGSWDKATSLFSLKTQFALAGAFFVACDLASSTTWKRRLCLTIGITGLSIVFLGLSQRALRAPSIFWLDEDTGGSFFGAYRYHANAGAFLNLIWPILACLLIQSWRKQGAYVERALWYSALFLAVASCFINTSRAASAITLILLLICIVLFRSRVRIDFSRWSIPFRVLVLCLVLGFIFILAWGGASEGAREKWGQLQNQLTLNNQRYLVYGACLKTIPEAGWFGYGPGTFSAVFPLHTAYLGDRLQGFWRYAHEDYLQTVIEYGYVGASLWGLLFFGSLYKALRRSFYPLYKTNDALVYQASAASLLGVALHSLVDFPLQIVSIQLYVMMFFALAWAKSERRIPSKSSSAQAENSRTGQRPLNTQ